MPTHRIWMGARLSDRAEALLHQAVNVAVEPASADPARCEVLVAGPGVALPADLSKVRLIAWAGDRASLPDGLQAPVVTAEEALCGRVVEQLAKPPAELALTRTLELYHALSSLAAQLLAGEPESILVEVAAGGLVPGLRPFEKLVSPGVQLSVQAAQLDGPEKLAVAMSNATGRVRLAGAHSKRGPPRLLRIDRFEMDAPIEGNLTFIRFKDVAGVIGRVGTAFGEAGVSIERLHLARSAGEGVLLIQSEGPAPVQTIEALRRIPGMDRLERLRS